MGEPSELVALLKIPNTDSKGLPKNDLTLMSTFNISNQLTILQASEGVAGI
jgi:hypothetical protein